MRWFLDRIAHDPWLWGLRVALVITGLFFALVLSSVLSGCATAAEIPPSPVAAERHLTEEQDQKIAELCADGCAILPTAEWYRIQRALKACGYSGI